MTEKQFLLERYHYLVNSGHSQRAACTSLGIPRSTMQHWLQEAENTAETPDGPRILILDLETAPTLYAGFGRFKQNFTQDHVVREGGYILTAAWKFLGDAEVSCDVCDDPETGDDAELVANLWDQIEAADVVVGQNVDDFDLGIIKSRLAKWNLPTLKPVKVVDTLKIARRMKFNSNSLDSLAAYLGVGRKVKHAGISLWINVCKNDPVAMQEMLDYNKGDVELTEEVYLKLRAFDQKTPGLGHYYKDEKHRCPACGSDNVAQTGNVIHTPVSEFLEYQCQVCYHRSRTRSSINSKNKRSSILLTPR